LFIAPCLTSIPVGNVFGLVSFGRGRHPATGMPMKVVLIEDQAMFRTSEKICREHLHLKVW